MRKFLTVLIIVVAVATLYIIFMGFFGSDKQSGDKSQEARFWTWFVENHDRLYDYEKDQESIFGDLGTEIKKIHPDLTFEFGPILEDGKREFVISAGGMREAMPAVEKLAESAPPLEQWQIIKYRQRKGPVNDISFRGITLGMEDFFFRLREEGEKVGIGLFHDGFALEDNEAYYQSAFLLMDSAIGEYDMMTKVGVIDFLPTNSEYFVNAKPLTELAKEFDAFLSLAKQE